MLEINWAPIVGALVVTKKSWDDMTPEAQAAVRAASDKAGVQIRTKARQEVDEAVDAMKKRGLVVNKPNAEQMRAWNDLARNSTHAFAAPWCLPRPLMKCFAT